MSWSPGKLVFYWAGLSIFREAVASVGQLQVFRNHFNLSALNYYFFVNLVTLYSFAATMSQCYIIIIIIIIIIINNNNNNNNTALFLW